MGAKASRLLTFHANGAGKSAITAAQLEIFRTQPDAFPDFVCGGIEGWRRASCRWAQILGEARIDGHGRLLKDISFSMEKDEAACNLTSDSLSGVWTLTAWDVTSDLELRWPRE